MIITVKPLNKVWILLRGQYISRPHKITEHTTVTATVSSVNYQSIILYFFPRTIEKKAQPRLTEVPRTDLSWSFWMSRLTISGLLAGSLFTLNWASSRGTENSLNSPKKNNIQKILIQFMSIEIRFFISINFINYDKLWPFLFYNDFVDFRKIFKIFF